MSDQEQMWVFVGTYNRRGSEGIYLYRLDVASVALELVSTAAVADNPSYLALHPSGRYLYAINEVRTFAGQPGGGITALSFDPASGKMAVLNSQSVVGTGPCYVSVERTGRYALSGNYAGGSICMLPIQEDGTLGPASDFVQHVGASVNPQRQQEPHAHSIVVDPTNRYAFVPDLGLDRVMIYEMDLDAGKLKANPAQPWQEIAPGSGPRHFCFHPDGQHAYVINELASTVTAFEYDGGAGKLKPLQMLPTLPEGYAGRSHCADIHVSPDGRFLYGSNRGHDSLAIYAIEQGTGQLTPVGIESTRGMTPRGFCIDPTGAIVLVAHQDTDNIISFRRDPASGELQLTRQMVQVPAPVCVKMMPIV